MPAADKTCACGAAKTRIGEAVSEKLDYVPASLVEAAFRCVTGGALDLPAAIALVTDRPARMAHLLDRGRIKIGLRADLVRVRVHEGLPIVRQVWRAGERVI